jgi:hypothetical protein
VGEIGALLISLNHWFSIWSEPMRSDLAETAKGLIETLEELVEEAEFISDDYDESLRIEGFLEGVGRYLSELLEPGLCLPCQLEAAMAGDEEAKAALEERQDLVKLAVEEDDPNAIAYLKERYGIDLELAPLPT